MCVGVKYTDKKFNLSHYLIVESVILIWEDKFFFLQDDVIWTHFQPGWLRPTLAITHVDQAVMEVLWRNKIKET